MNVKRLRSPWWPSIAAAAAVSASSLAIDFPRPAEAVGQSELSAPAAPEVVPPPAASIGADLGNRRGETFDLEDISEMRGKRSYEGVVTGVGAIGEVGNVTIDVEGVAYSVHLYPGATIFSPSWTQTELGHVEEGDRVRIYGAPSENYEGVIFALVLRDLEVKRY